MMSKDKSNKKNDALLAAGEDIVQAVVIADSFNYRFLPITSEKPRALLPLVNRPLLDYTIDFLAASGVHQIFVYCSSHAGMVKSHLEKSKFSKPNSPVQLTIMMSENCYSLGDAMRDIDSQSLISSDFILVSGDLVSNMKLQQAIVEHKERKKKDKMSVMTVVYKKASPDHRTRSKEDDILVAFNTSDHRLLHCEKIKKKKKMTIPLSLFEGKKQVDLHYDLLDCHVSICSPIIPQLFSDNFDYQTRDHFIRGILVNEEILGNHIYTYIISDQYAARVCNLHTYDAISKDVMHRWVYPLVPDIAPTDESPYSYGRHNIYLNSDVTLARGCILEHDVAVAGGTRIGADTFIANSVIGPNCVIEDNCHIEGSYLWSNVKVHKGSRVVSSIVADRVEIKSNVTVEPGCIISFEVVIGPNFTVPAGSRITSKVDVSIDDDNGGFDSDDEKDVKTIDENTQQVSAKEVGSEGFGYLWHSRQADNNADEDIIVEKWAVQAESSDSDDVGSVASSRGQSLGPSFEDMVDAEVLMQDQFYTEVLESIRLGIAEVTDIENLILEINSSKHAYNIPIDDVPVAIIRAILEGPQNEFPSTIAMLSYIEQAINKLQSLLQHYMKNHSVQVKVLGDTADSASQNPKLLAGFAKIVLFLYNVDVIKEQAILEWYEGLQANSSTSAQEVLAKIQPVIVWLQTAEEESSSEEET
ncbi:translation initiation factor eIF2B subunit epsilon-like [Dysidea avara]|uniref:translation initiation factor eIF2B subunit epsilon-like n=1 Tax=Dysidea avara TaxID=196820 RepID=UPI00331A5F09